MITVYLDNFRGFQDDKSLLTPVTFLVGENSTGKTSFLSAVELLSSFEFWVEPSFGKSDTNLGSFQDIVSVNAKKRDYFTIGWAFWTPEPSPRHPVFALLTFKERRNKPRLFRFSFLYHDSIVKIQYSARSIGYKIDKLPKGKRTVAYYARQFATLARSNRARLQGLTSVDEGVEDVLMRSPYFGPRHIVRGFESKKGDSTVGSPVMFSGGSLKSIAPIRTGPRPIYESVEADADERGSHTPYVLRRELSKKNSKLRTSLRAFGEASGLFKDIAVHDFGKGQASPSGSGAPFEIGVVLDGKPINLPYVGYGVSQVLPIVVDVLLGSTADVYLVQQPEVHLHPRAQAALGDLIHRIKSFDDRSFLIETHSDFLIDRYRLARHADSHSVENEPSSVLYFEQKAGFNSTFVVEIERDGSYDDDQPRGFREFFMKEQIELLKI